MKKQSIFENNLPWLFLLLLVPFIFYIQTVSFEFLKWDDDMYVLKRNALHKVAKGKKGGWADLLGPSEAWNRKVWEYFPFRDFTYGLEVALGGMKSSIMHVTNLILHLLNGFLLFLLARRLAISPFLACFALLGFLIHPLTVEPVSWISGRKDLLYTCLSFAGLNVMFSLGTTDHEKPKSRWLLFYLFAFLAMMSKGAGLICVLLGGFTILWFQPNKRGKSLLWLLPLLLISIAWIILAIKIGERNSILIQHPDGYGRFFRAFGIPVRILQWYFYPGELSPVYEPWYIAWYKDPYAWGGLLCFILLLPIFFRAQEKQDKFWWLMACWVITILPHTGILTVAQLRADRFYYPVIGMTTLIFAFAFQKNARHFLKIAFLWFPLLSFWAYTNQNYVMIWENSTKFWSYVGTTHPTYPGYLINQAKKLPFQKAERLILQSLKETKRYPQKRIRYQGEVSSNNVILRIVLADIWERESHRWPKKKERLEKSAFEMYKQVIQIAPKTPAAYNGLAMMATKRQQWKVAEKYLRKQLKLPTTPPEIWLNLVKVLWRQERKKEGLQILQKLVKKYPKKRLFRVWYSGAKAEMQRGTKQKKP